MLGPMFLEWKQQSLACFATVYDVKCVATTVLVSWETVATTITTVNKVYVSIEHY